MSTANNADSPLRGRISVSRFETPGIYDDENIVYRIGDSEYGAYGSREWALPLGDMLGIMAEQVLRRQDLAQDAVFEPRSRDQFAYQWRGSVRQFEEVDEGSTIRAAVHLEARLLRVSDDSLLWHGDRLVEITVTEHTMPRIVGALSEAAQSALEELARQAKTAVQAGQPAVHPPNP
jgi:ABC-type uncharacterized transport system auxiliary subunit